MVLERVSIRKSEHFGAGAVTVEALSPGYQSLVEHAAWMDVSSRGKIRVLGEDRKRLLHAMTTNQVQKLEPGSGAYVFFLNVQGRILGDANLFVLEDSILLDTEPETRQKIREHLDRYIIADDVALEDATDSLATVAIEGPEAEDFLKQHAAPVPVKLGDTARWGDRIIARASTTGSTGFFIILPNGEKEDLLAQFSLSGIGEATPEEARVRRIESGPPRYGEEITERYLVQETGQMQAVSFDKGCYLGQEIVERVRSRAQIHRILHRIQIDTTEVPEPGAKIQFGTPESGIEDAGEIASAVLSPSTHKVVALAYVRIRFITPGAHLHLGSAPVTLL
jgi:folate-binding protein YgfZ